MSRENESFQFKADAESAQLEPNQPHSTIAMSLLYSDKNDLKKKKSC
jgi:hypothetical protein